MNVINLLSFENFIRTKVESIDENIERSIYDELLTRIGNHIKVFIVGTDLNRVLAYINNSTHPNRILELIPTIVQGINLNNFTDMNRIFDFCQQLPEGNQIQLISKVLSEMREKNQYKHVLHVICQINLLKNAIRNDRRWTRTEKYLHSGIEMPFELLKLLRDLSDDNSWQIENVSGNFLYFLGTPKYQKALLYTSQSGDNWYFQCQSYNSVAIRSDSNYLSVEYCFHNESFPTVKGRDNGDLTQLNWYFLMNDDLTTIEIKNIYTNESLISENIFETLDVERRLPRVALRANSSDSSQWLLQNSKIYPIEH